MDKQDKKTILILKLVFSICAKEKTNRILFLKHNRVSSFSTKNDQIKFLIADQGLLMWMI